MVKTNASADGFARMIAVDRAEQLEIFERLPREFRDLLNYAPINQAEFEVEELFRIRGFAALGLIEQLWDKQYPGWRVPKPKRLRRL